MTSLKGTQSAGDDYMRSWTAPDERIWCSGAYAGHFGDAFIDDTELEGGQIPPSLRALASVLDTVADGHTPVELQQPEDDILRRCASLFRESAEFGDRVSAARGRDVPIMLRTWHKLLMDLPVGGLQVVPGGWATTGAGHAIMHVIERTSQTTCNFVISNTGQGVDFHPSLMKYPKERFRTSIVLRDISLERLADPGVLFMLAQLRTNGKDLNGPTQVYDVLVPHLTGATLEECVKRTEAQYGSWAAGSFLPESSIPASTGVGAGGVHAPAPDLPTDGPALGHAPWTSLQRSGTCYYRAVLAAFKYLLHRWGVSADRQKAITLAVRAGYLRVALCQLRSQAGLDDCLATPPAPPSPAPGSVGLVRASSSAIELGVSHDRKVLELGHWETKMLALGCDLTAHAMGKNLKAGHAAPGMVPALYELIESVRAFIGGDEGQFIAPPDGTSLLSPQRAAEIGADPQVYELAHTGLLVPALGARVRVKLGLTALDDIGSASPSPPAEESTAHSSDTPLVTVYVSGASLSLPSLVQLGVPRDQLEHGAADAQPTAGEPATLDAVQGGAVLDTLAPLPGFDLLQDTRDTSVFMGGEAEGTPDAFVNLVFPMPGLGALEARGRAIAQAVAAAQPAPALDEEDAAADEETHAPAALSAPTPAPDSCAWEETLGVLKNTAEACDRVRQQAGSGDSAAGAALHTVMSLIETAMLQALPVPLPWSAERVAAGKPDAWTPEHITAGEQRDALALIQSVLCHYTAAYRSLPYDRNTVGTYLVTAAALCAAFDSTIRLVASDAPSPVSLLLQGVSESWADSKGVQLVPLIEAAGVEIDTAAAAAERKRKDTKEEPDNRPVQEILAARTAYKYAAQFAKAKTCALPAFAPAFSLLFHLWETTDADLAKLTDYALGSSAPLACAVRPAVCAYWEGQKAAAGTKGEDMVVPPPPGEEPTPPPQNVSAQIQLPSASGRFNRALKFTAKDVWVAFTQYLLVDMKQANKMPPSAPPLPFTDTQVAASAAASGQGAFLYTAYWLSEDWEAFPEYNMLRSFLVLLTSVPAVFQRPNACYIPLKTHFPDDAHSQWSIQRNYAAENAQQGAGGQDAADLEVKHFGMVWSKNTQLQTVPEFDKLSSPLSLVGLKAAPRAQRSGGGGGASGVMGRIMQAMTSGDMQGVNDILIEAADEHDIPLPEDMNDPAQGMQFMAQVMAKIGGGGGGMPGGMGGIMPMIMPGGGGAGGGAPGGCPMQTALPPADQRADAEAVNATLLAPRIAFVLSPSDERDACIAACLAALRSAVPTPPAAAAGNPLTSTAGLDVTGTDDEERILRVQALPTFDSSLSPQDSEALMGLLTVPYLRIPLLLRFFSENRLGALFHPRLQLLLERVLLEPGPMAAPGSKVRPTQLAVVPADSASESELFATPAGLLVNELWHSPEGVTDPLLQIANSITGLCGGHYSSTFTKLLFFVLKLVHRVETSLVFVAEAHAAGDTLGTLQGKATARALGQLRHFTLHTARACILRYLEQTEEDFERLGKAAANAAAAADAAVSGASEAVAADRDEVTRMQVNLHAHHALLFAFLAVPSVPGRALDSDGESSVTELTPQHAQSLLASAAFVSAWSSPSTEQPLGSEPEAIVQADGNTHVVPTSDVFRALARQRRSILSTVDALPPAARDAMLDAVLSTSLRRPEARPGWEAASKPAFKCTKQLQSAHPYLPAVDQYTTLSFPGAESMTLTFDGKSSTQSEHDYVIIYTSSACASYWGAGKYSLGDGWPGAGGRPPLVIPADTAVLHFHSSGESKGDWGWAVSIEATINAAAASELSHERLPAETKHALSLAYPQQTLPATAPLSWAQAAMAECLNDAAAARAFLHSNAAHLAEQLGLDGSKRPDAEGTDNAGVQSGLFRDGTGSVQIDVQTGEIFIKNRSRAPVPSSLANHSNFTAVFGNERPLASLLKSKLHAKTYELDHGLFTYRLVAWSPVGAPPVEREAAALQGQAAPPAPAADGAVPPPAPPLLRKSSSAVAADDDEFALTEQATHWGVPRRVKGAVHWRGSVYSSRFSAQTFAHDLEEALVEALVAAELPSGAQRDWYVLPEGQRSRRHGRNRVAEAEDVFSTSRLTARVLREFEWLVPSITATLALVENHVVQAKEASTQGGDVGNSGGKGLSRMWTPNGCMHSVAAMVLQALGLGVAADKQQQAAQTAMAAETEGDTASSPVDGQVPLRALWFVPPGGDFLQRLGKAGTWYSVELLAQRRVVNIYQLLETGRHTQRTLVASSDSRYALRSIDVVPSTMAPDQLRHARYAVACPYTLDDPAALIRARNRAAARAAKRSRRRRRRGDAAAGAPSAGSIVVSRKFAAAGDSGLFSRTWESHVPHYLLYGSVPHALIEAYEFWKGIRPTVPSPPGADSGSQQRKAYTTVVRGYPSGTVPGAAGTVVEIELLENGQGTVRRFTDAAFKAHTAALHAVASTRQRANKTTGVAAELQAETERAVWPLYIDAMCELDTKAVSVLIDVTYASRSAPARRIADALCRIESLSHILVWSHSLAPIGAQVPVSRVELPRLGTSFTPKPDARGVLRVYCDEFAGHFLSDDRDASILKHMAGIPHSVLLANSAGEHSILVPNLPLHRPQAKSEPFTTDIIAGHGEGWEDAVSSRLYRYPIHASGAFLTVPSVASAWYLVLLRLLHRDYEGAAELLPACATDVAFSAEEEWVASMVNRTAGEEQPDGAPPAAPEMPGASEIKIDAPDMHPNIHALRLRLALIQHESGQSGPLKADILKKDFGKYVSKLPHVAAFARLTPSEELDVANAIAAWLGSGTAGDFDKRRREHASLVLSVLERNAAGASKVHAARAALQARLKALDSAPTSGIGAADMPPTSPPPLSPGLSRQVSTHRGTTIIRTSSAQSPHPFANALLTESATAGAAAGAATAETQRNKVLYQTKRFAGATDIAVEFDPQSSLGKAGTLCVYALPALPPRSDDATEPQSAIESDSGTFENESALPTEWRLVESFSKSATDGANAWPGCLGQPAISVEADGVALVFVPDLSQPAEPADAPGGLSLLGRPRRALPWGWKAAFSASVLAGNEDSDALSNAVQLIRRPSSGVPAQSTDERSEILQALEQLVEPSVSEAWTLSGPSWGKGSRVVLNTLQQVASMFTGTGVLREGGEPPAPAHPVDSVLASWSPAPGSIFEYTGTVLDKATEANGVKVANPPRSLRACRYVRPKPEPDAGGQVAWWELLEKCWNDDTPEIMDRVERPGFMFLYEVLTSAVPVDICTVMPKADQSLRTDDEDDKATGGAAAGGMAAADEKLRAWMDEEREAALGGAGTAPAVTSAATATYVRLILLGMLAHYSQGQEASRVDTEAYHALIAATYAARAAAERNVATDVQARAQMAGGAVGDVATRMGPDAGPGDVFTHQHFPMLPLHDLSQAILSQERSVVAVEYFVTVQFKEFTQALGDNGDLAQSFQFMLGQQAGRGGYGLSPVPQLLWHRVQQCLVRAMNSGMPLEEQRQINEAKSLGASGGVLGVVGEAEAADYIRAHASWQAQTVIIDASSAGPRRPVITDCTCACRTIAADASGPQYESDLLQFASTPLQQIADSHVVEVPGEGHAQHNAGRLTDTLPFDLSVSKRGAAAADSAVGSGMVGRMAADLSESSLQASARMQHQLSTINSATLHELRASLAAASELVAQLESPDALPSLAQASGFTPQTAAQVKAAIADLRQLRSALQELAAVDQALTASTLRELVVRANSVEHAGEAPEGERLAFALCRSHGDTARVTFSYLAACVMSPEPEASVRQLNPYLPQEEVAQLVHETQLLLLRSNRVSQIERCISDSNSVEARMMQLVVTRLSAACGLLVQPGTCVPDKAAIEQAIAESGSDPLAAADLLAEHMRASAATSKALTSMVEQAAVSPTETARLRAQVPALAALLLNLHHRAHGSFGATPAGCDELLQLVGGSGSDGQRASLRGAAKAPAAGDVSALQATAHVLEAHAMSRSAFQGQLLALPPAAAREVALEVQVTRFAQAVKSSSALLHVLRHSAQRLAGQLTAKRQFMFPGPQPNTFQYDPRFLVFEFVSTFILRRRQIELVNDFLRAAYAGDSSVCQMIMGQGKTTVVGPLLALILADGSTLVTQVCPSPLLEQTKAVLRGVFCSVIAKRVLTLKFDRSNAAFFPDEAGGGLAAGLPKLRALVSKLERARADRAIVATTPETLKSIMLKYVDLLATAAEAPVETRMPTQDISARVVAAAAKRHAQNVVAAEAAADHLRNLMSLWGGTAVWDGVLKEQTSAKVAASGGEAPAQFPGLLKAVPSSGVMLLDEVDLLLHSLKSELNFPVGVKHRLHMWPRRWELPLHLLDLLFASCDATSAVAQLMSEGTAPAAAEHSEIESKSEHVATPGTASASGAGEVMGLTPSDVVSGMGRVAVPGFRPSRESDAIVEDMRQALAFGVQSFAVQPLPHPTLLSPSFYDGYLKRVIARWAIMWLRTQAAVQRAFGSLPLATAVPGVTALAGLATSEPAEVTAARAAAFRAPDTRSMAGEFLIGNAPALGAEAEAAIVKYICGAKVPESDAAGFVAAAVGGLTEDVAAVTASIALDPGAMAQPDEEVDGEAKPLAPEAAIAALHELPGHAMQCVNLARDWVTTFMPHCMSKINRVSYGLLTPRDVARYTPEALARMPRSRKLLAVPFVGKDVPSDASEFAHPEVLIGLSICAMRYEGVRESDLKVVMKSLKSDLQHEPGRMEHRPTRVLFSDWLARADSDFVRVLDALNLSSDVRRSLLTASPSQAVLPLELAQPREETQFNAMFAALRRSPEVISHYLRHHVFMEVMRHQDIKLTATGVDLGSDMLFGVRLGFSGTPSDLLPLSLRPCHYEPGSEADIVRTLTSDELVDAITLAEWSVTSLLKFVATASPPFHALIDTGALVTGMNNEQVARFLLAVGLPGMRGCVFLNDADRKCIVLREGGTVMRLEECGIPPSQRFTFYDQTHCTGMHIDQALDARAAITLGKDMTLRDYAQGAWRMRGLGKGQTLTAIVVPEVRELIEGVVKKDKRSKHGTATKVNMLSVEQVVSGAPPLPDSPDSVASSVGSMPPPPPPLVLQNSLSASVPLAVRISTQASELHLNLPAAVVAWLTFNSIKSEQLQYLALCQQNISYAWRRTAFTDLMTSTQPKQHSIDAHGIATRFHDPVSDAEKRAFLQSVPSLAAQLQAEAASGAPAEDPTQMTEGQRLNNRLADLIARDPEALTEDEQMEMVMLMSSLDAEAPPGESEPPQSETKDDADAADVVAETSAPAQPADIVRGSAQWLQMCVSAFREPLDMAVVDELPLPQRFEDKLDDAVRQWRALIDAEADRPVRGAGPDGDISTRQYVQAVLDEAALAASASDQDGDEDKALAHDKEMVQEQEKEQEQEAQVEIQQEVETQFADGSDAVMPWPLTALRVPDAPTEDTDGEAASSPTAKLAAMVAASGPSVQTLLSEGLFYPLADLELLRGKGALKFPTGLLVSQNHTPQLASPSLPRRLRNVTLVLQLPVNGSAPQSVLLSLVEAQTVRRAMHLRHPALRKGSKTPAAGIVLRMANGVAVDGGVARLGDEGAAAALPTPPLTQQRVAAKFFNNTAWFSDAEVLGLVTALKGASPAEREAFYAESIIGRRRDKQAWGETGLRSVFRLADESSLLQIRQWVDAARETLMARHGTLQAAYASVAGSVATPISTAAFARAMASLQVAGLDDAAAEALAVSVDSDHDGQLTFADFHEAFRPLVSGDARARDDAAAASGEGKDSVLRKLRAARAAYEAHALAQQQQADDGPAALDDDPSLGAGAAAAGAGDDADGEVFVAKQVAQATGTIADHLNASEVLSVGELLLTSGGSVSIDSDAVVSGDDDGIASVSPRRVLLKRKQYFFECNVNSLAANSARTGEAHRIGAVGFGDARFTGDSHADIGVGDAPSSWGLAILAVPARDVVMPAGADLPSGDADEDQVVFVAMLRLAGAPHAGCSLDEGSSNEFLNLLAPHATPQMRNVTVTAASVAAAQPLAGIRLFAGDAIGATVDADACTVRFTVNNKPVVDSTGAERLAALNVRGGFVASASVTRHAALSVNIGSLPFRHMPPAGAYSIRRAGRRTQEVKVVREAGDAAGKFVPTAEVEGIQVKNNVVKNIGYFPTAVMAGVLLTSGKWYYECTALVKGHGSQIGWGDIEFCGLGGGRGAGDDEHSYAFDGERVCLWHKQSSPPFGRAWHNGDTIGFAVDLDARTMSFGINGQWTSPLGKAFSDITFSCGLTPAVTPQGSATFAFNMGEAPMRFPPPGEEYNTVWQWLVERKPDLAKRTKGGALPGEPITIVNNPENTVYGLTVRQGTQVVSDDAPDASPPPAAPLARGVSTRNTVRMLADQASVPLRVTSGFRLVSRRGNGYELKVQGALPPSIVADQVSVRSGKWYYEVRLNTAAGSSQVVVGWADLTFTGRWAARRTVGDDGASWGWNAALGEYRHGGKGFALAPRKLLPGGLPAERVKLSAGDVIGVALDADVGTLSFTVNGAWDTRASSSEAAAAAHAAREPTLAERRDAAMARAAAAQADEDWDAIAKLTVEIEELEAEQMRQDIAAAEAADSGADAAGAAAAAEEDTPPAPPQDELSAAGLVAGALDGSFVGGLVPAVSASHDTVIAVNFGGPEADGFKFGPPAGYRGLHERLGELQAAEISR